MNHPFLARSCHWTLFSHTIFLFPVYVVFVWVILNSSRGKNSFHVLVHSSTGRIRDERDQRLPVDHATTLQNWSLVMSTQCRSISVMSCKHRLHRVISQDQELHAPSRRLRDLTRRCESTGSHLIQVRVCDRFTLHHFTTNLYNRLTGISEHGGENRGRVTGRLRTRGREGLVNYRIVFFSPGVYCQRMMRKSLLYYPTYCSVLSVLESCRICFSTQRWKEHDVTPLDEMTLLDATKSAGDNMTAEACGGWIWYNGQLLTCNIARKNLKLCSVSRRDFIFCTLFVEYCFL